MLTRGLCGALIGCFLGLVLWAGQSFFMNRPTRIYLDLSNLQAGTISNSQGSQASSSQIPYFRSLVRTYGLVGAFELVDPAEIQLMARLIYGQLRAGDSKAAEQTVQSIELTAGRKRAVLKVLLDDTLSRLQKGTDADEQRLAGGLLTIVRRETASLSTKDRATILTDLGVIELELGRSEEAKKTFAEAASLLAEIETESNKTVQLISPQGVVTSEQFKAEPEDSEDGKAVRSAEGITPESIESLLQSSAPVSKISPTGTNPLLLPIIIETEDSNLGILVLALGALGSMVMLVLEPGLRLYGRVVVAPAMADLLKSDEMKTLLRADDSNKGKSSSKPVGIAEDDNPTHA